MQSMKISNKKIKLFHKESDGFIAVWYSLLTHITDNNIDRKQKLEKEIKDCVVSKFPQQDLTKMVEFILPICKELDAMDCYSTDNNIRFLDSFSYGGSRMNPTDPNTMRYRTKIIKMRDDVDDAIRDT